MHHKLKEEGEIDAIIFVMKKDVFSEYQLKCLAIYKDLFGDNFMEHVICVITHVDFEYNMTADRFKKKIMYCKENYQSELFISFS